MKNGMYDISIEEYHASEGISRSGIMTFKRSAYHYWSEYLSPDRPPREKSTDAAIIGNALHTLILEPAEFDNRYSIKLEKTEPLPKSLLLKDLVAEHGKEHGRQLYDEAKSQLEAARQKIDEIETEFLIKSLGKTILTQQDYDNLLVMQQKLFSDQQVKGLIEGGEFEKSIYWTDPHTGVLCKCRPDILHSNMVGDLKTAFDASEREFQRSIHSYGYHIQAGMIHEGVREAFGFEIKNFDYIVQEKKYPHAHAIYRLDNSALEAGIAIFKNLLLDVKKCYAQESWPSYPLKIISLPSYAGV